MTAVAESTAPSGFGEKTVAWYAWLIVIAFTALSLLLLFFLLWGIQWITVDGASICARNVFGVIKRIEMSNIKTARTFNVTNHIIRGYIKFYPAIVLATRKTLNLCNVGDMYNHIQAFQTFLLV